MSTVCLNNLLKNIQKINLSCLFAEPLNEKKDSQKLKQMGGKMELKYEWQTIAIKIHKAADRQDIYLFDHLYKYKFYLLL